MTRQNASLPSRFSNLESANATEHAPTATESRQAQDLALANFNASQFSPPHRSDFLSMTSGSHSVWKIILAKIHVLYRLLRRPPYLGVRRAEDARLEQNLANVKTLRQLRVGGIGGSLSTTTNDVLAC